MIANTTNSYTISIIRMNWYIGIALLCSRKQNYFYRNPARSSGG